MDIFKSASGGETPHEKCTSRLKTVLEKNERVHKLIDAIEGLGCKVPSDFFSCRPCEDKVSGGFVVDSGSSHQITATPYKPKIILCEVDVDKVTFENTVVHELVHAYDQCKMKIDWKNCLHHACTEVRASSLSGECDYRQEFNRGHMKMQRGGLECVQRRATMSVAANPHCTEVAKDAVIAVYDYCSRDIAPLDRADQK